MTINFHIVENAPSAWDKEPEIIQLYTNGEPVANIRKRVGVSAPTFNKILRKLKEDGKITPRRKPYKKRKNKNKRLPKHWVKCGNRPGFNIMYHNRYFGYVRTRRQAERFVELMQEYEWDYNKRLKVKQQVKEEFP